MGHKNFISLVEERQVKYFKFNNNKLLVNSITKKITSRKIVLADKSPIIK